MAKYYKKVSTIVESSWTQPIATSAYNNDYRKAFAELGGNSFAVYADKALSNGALWRAFDSEAGTYCVLTATTTDNSIYFYNPNPLKIGCIITLKGFEAPISIFGKLLSMWYLYALSIALSS